MVGEFYAFKERMVSPTFYEKSERVRSTPEIVFEDETNPILSEQEWLAVQERLSLNRELAVRNTQRDYGPLHRLVRCDRCQRSMNVDANKRDPSFRCPQCRRRASTRGLWKQVRGYLVDILSDPDRCRRWAQALVSTGRPVKQLEQDIGVRKAELVELEEKEQRAIHLAVDRTEYADRFDSILRELASRKARLQSEIRVREAELQEIRRQEISAHAIERTAGELGRVVPELDDKRWRDLLILLDFRVYFDSPGNLRFIIKQWPLALEDSAVVLQPS